MVRYRYGGKNQISYGRNPFNFFEAVKATIDYDNIDVNSFNGMALSGLLIERSLREIRKCKDEKIRREYYEFLRHYVRDRLSGISFSSEKFQSKKEYVIKCDYESFWDEAKLDFTGQLIIHEPDLIKALEGKTAVLWGLGKRGKAFLEIKKKLKLSQLYVTDKYIRKLGDYGIPRECIIESENVWSVGECIVASNHRIYLSIVDKCREYGYECIDLEEYCPWD